MDEERAHSGNGLMKCAAKRSRIFTAGLIGVAFSTELPECDRTFSRSVSLRDLKMGRFDIKKVVNGIPNVTKMGSMICHRIF